MGDPKLCLSSPNLPPRTTNCLSQPQNCPQGPQIAPMTTPNLRPPTIVTGTGVPPLAVTMSTRHRRHGNSPLIGCPVAMVTGVPPLPHHHPVAMVIGRTPPPPPHPTPHPITRETTPASPPPVAMETPPPATVSRVPPAALPRCRGNSPAPIPPSQQRRPLSRRQAPPPGRPRRMRSGAGAGPGRV